MGYILLSQAREFISPGFGECDPAKLTQAVNQIRQHMFGWYRDVALFLDAVECFRVQNYALNCNDCSDTYSGITLPREMQQVEALWFNDFPVQLYSGWREFQQGISPECDCRLQKLDVPGVFCTFADLVVGHPKKLIVKAFEEVDRGKRFVVRGRTVAGNPFVHEFRLDTEPQETPDLVKSIDSAGILKSPTVGRVVLADEEGRLLGLYEPEQTVPTLKRIKITGLPSDCSAVNVRASRRYYPLVGDDDVVETDNEVALDSMARYLRLFRRSDKSAADIRTEKDFYATAMSMMLGEKKRDEGRGTRAEIRMATAPFGGMSGRSLNRFGRSTW